MCNKTLTFEMFSIETCGNDSQKGRTRKLESPMLLNMEYDFCFFDLVPMGRILSIFGGKSMQTSGCLTFKI